MNTQTETGHACGFIISEANGNRSRDNVTLLSGENVKAGEVLGKVTATGKYRSFDTGNGDGSEVAAGIALYDCDATSGDTVCAALTNHAEVNVDELVFKDQSPPDDIDDARAGLLAQGIKVR